MAFRAGHPDIPPETAKRIVNWRWNSGFFRQCRSPEDIVVRAYTDPIELKKSKRKPWELPKPKTQKKIVEFKGLDELRKMAEKALDDWIEVMKPFGKWESFADCVSDMKSRGYSEDSAKRICGKLQAELEKEDEDDEFDRVIEEFGGEVEKQYNPYAICRAGQKKYGWSEEKYERCVRHVKEQNRRYGRPERGYEEKQERTGDIEPIDILGRKPKRESGDVQIKERGG
jgi:hypothetical protein